MQISKTKVSFPLGLVINIFFQVKIFPFFSIFVCKFSTLIFVLRVIPFFVAIFSCIFGFLAQKTIWVWIFMIMSPLLFEISNFQNSLSHIKWGTYFRLVSAWAIFSNIEKNMFPLKILPEIFRKVLSHVYLSMVKKWRNSEGGCYRPWWYGMEFLISSRL